MRNRQHKCKNCIWYDKCVAVGVDAEDCDDFDPVDTGDELTYYDSILAENIAEYQLVEEEYSDGRYS